MRPAGPDGTPAHQLAIALIFLCAAAVRAWLAYRRQAPAASFPVRFLVPSVSTALCFAAMQIVEPGTGFDLGEILVMMSIFTLGTALLILLVELITRRLNPTRSAGSLVLASLLFPGIVLSPGIVNRLSEARPLLDQDAITFGVATFGTAVLWWSCLPLDRARLGSIFE